MFRNFEVLRHFFQFDQGMSDLDTWMDGLSAEFKFAMFEMN